MATCEVCGVEYRPLGTGRRTCSNVCGGKLRSSEISGSGHWNWTDGRVRTRQGYIRVWVPDDHPYVSMRAKGTNHVLEHRLVVAQHFGRLLRNDETVHHINGVRDDNRIENLQLRQGAHGSGSVKACGDCGSRNLVSVTIA